MTSKMLSLALLFLLAVCTTTFAQQEFVWEKYKMGITLPNDFKVITNTNDEFECDGDGMHLYIYIFEDEKVDFKMMVKETRNIAKKLKFDITDEVNDFKDDDGFEGRYVLGMKDGRQVMLCGMLNTKSAANFWVVIEFEDGDHTAEKDGLKILHSITQHAAAEQEYVWAKYKMSITLPNDFKVLTNTDSEFECDGNGMHLYINIFEDEKVDFKMMVKETKNIAKKLKFDVTDEVHDFKDDDGFEGRYVLGMKDGRQVMLCGMINTQSAANFWVVIEFEDGDHTAEKDGLAILHSIAQH
jgi:uncharacterized protein YifE (UPF0438 family)